MPPTRAPQAKQGTTSLTFEQRRRLERIEANRQGRLHDGWPPARVVGWSFDHAGPIVRLTKKGLEKKFAIARRGALIPV